MDLNGGNITEYLDSLLQKVSEAQNRQLSDISPDHSTYQRSAGFDDSPNPAVITSYREALRYLFKYMSINEELKIAVRRCLEEQSRNELEWSKTRQDWIEANRPKFQNTHLQNEHGHQQPGSMTIALLRETTASSQKQQYEKGLQELDMKIYKACEQMTKAHEQILRDLRVPLFCVSETTLAAVERDAKTQSLLHEQRRLLEVLKDLFDEENTSARQK